MRVRMRGVRGPVVSPVRIATARLVHELAEPLRSAACRMPASGARRFFSTSTASARSGEM